jgi:hypothetical protein
MFCSSRLPAFMLHFLSLVSVACGGGAKDIVPESRDVRVTDPAAIDDAYKKASDGYVYVARRSLGIVALAEARGMDDAVATRVIDRLADQLDACAATLAKQGKLVSGALRVVAPVTADGAIGAINLKLAPGNDVAANALLCLVAPLKLIAFPPADAGARGLAIEATWGPTK